MRGTIQALTSEHSELKKYEEIRNQDNHKLVMDIQTITKENQFIKDQLKERTDERDYYKSQTDQATGSNRHMEQTIRSVEMEKNDIQQSYKEVC